MSTISFQGPEGDALAKLRIKVLRKLHKDEFGDACAGCKGKTHFVSRILELRSHNDGGAPATTKGKDEL